MSKFVFAGNEIIPGTLTVTEDATIIAKDFLKVMLNITGNGNVQVSDGTDQGQEIQLMNKSASSCSVTYTDVGGSVTVTLDTNKGMKLLWVGGFYKCTLSGLITGTDINGNPINYLSEATINTFPNQPSHNIIRLYPKDITEYYQDGSLWDRLNGTNGFSLFEDIYVGDYFQMSSAIKAAGSGVEGTDWVTIAGIDSLMYRGYNSGDASDYINYHHLVMVPGKGNDLSSPQHFGQARMHSTTSSYTGGYTGTEMHTATLGAVVSSIGTGTSINQKLYNEFTTHLKKTWELLATTNNATSWNRTGAASGTTTNWAWTQCQAVLMSEPECYGAISFASSGFDIGSATTQLPLFACSEIARNNRTASYWLKCMASAAAFCGSYDGGGYASLLTSTVATYCVRPRFVIA